MGNDMNKNIVAIVRADEKELAIVVDSEAQLWQEVSKLNNVTKVQIYDHVINSTVKSNLTIDGLIQAFCECRSVDYRQLKSSSRTFRLSQNRKLLCYALKCEFDLSSTDIAYLINYKHHSSVIAAIKEIEMDLRNDPQSVLITNLRNVAIWLESKGFKNTSKNV